MNKIVVARQKMFITLAFSVNYPSGDVNHADLKSNYPNIFVLMPLYASLAL
ncbi:protein of unknown function [Xenorhabdus nematophila AN6/1]|nr:protein of unknown function [Xenorhabdus nematophila AN6/1]